LILDRLRPHAPALAVALLAFAMAAAVAATPQLLFDQGSFAAEQRARRPGYHGIRLVRDDIDRNIYAQRGEFAVKPGARPYREVTSEYPELATYFFALPYLVTRSVATYRIVFSVLMAAAMGGLAFVVADLARRLGRSPARALLLLLPGTLYFGINRFDALPALLSVGAASALLGRRTALAHVLLAAAFLTKAYAVLYLPLFLAVSVRDGGRRRAARDLAIFVGVIAVASAQLALWAGVDAVLAPFRYQLGRQENPESLYHYIAAGLALAARPWLKGIFLGLQAAPAALAIVGARDGDRAILRWMTAITIAFVVFSRFQSPQWVVWITPLAAVAASGPLELALVVALDVLAYVYFPLGYDIAGAKSPALATIIGILTGLRLVLAATMVMRREKER